MATIGQLLAHKGSDVWRVTPDTSVFDAMAMMADKGVGALLVMQGERVAGIVSERDYARKMILQERPPRATPVSQIMTTQVLVVSPERSVDECMALMTDKRIRHLPVMQDERVLGVISIGDIVKSLIAEQQYLIRELQSYIAG